MRWGILSDTHNQLERTRRAVDLLQRSGAEVLFHCGDLASAPIVLACATMPCYFTFGNHDTDSVPELLQAAYESGAKCLGWGDVIELAGKQIGLVHGHLTTDLRRVLREEPDYLFSGHSHSCSDSLIGSTRRINPGALHRANEFSVAMLDSDSDELVFFSLPR